MTTIYLMLPQIKSFLSRKGISIYYYAILSRLLNRYLAFPVRIKKVK